MEKRGLSHVEAIVSFVLFVGFLFVAFYFFSPFQGTNRVLDSSLDYAISEIINDATEQIETYEVSIDKGITEKDVTIEINRVLTEVNASVLNYTGSVLNSDLEGNRVSLDRTARKYNFIKVIFSKGVTEPTQFTSPAVLLNPDNYTISSSEIREIVSEAKVLEIESSYLEDYMSLKQSFNLPNRVDFSFDLIFKDGSSISTEKEIPVELEVISKSQRVEVLRSNGALEFADLVVKVW